MWVQLPWTRSLVDVRTRLILATLPLTASFHAASCPEKSGRAECKYQAEYEAEEAFVPLWA